MRLGFLGLVFFASSFSFCAADEFKAGAAKTDITPPTGYAMWGYGARHDEPSEGVLDHLFARALVFEIGKVRVAIVSLDLGRAPTRQTTQAIRAKVKAAVGIEHLFLIASHTHHGPVLEVNTWPDAKKPYVRELEQKLTDVIIEAAKSLQPARFGIASKEVPFNRNRHSKRADKPVDKELLVLRIEDGEGKPIAHAVNFAAHPTMQDSRVFKFSADYPAAMAALVERETTAPCLFLQGAAGDLSANPGTEVGPDKFGSRLGREVLDMIKTISCKALDKPTLKLAEDDFRFKSRIDFGNPLIKGMFVKAFFQDLVDFYEREYREGVQPHMSIALLDNRIGFVGVSGEFFCGHSISLKRRARLEHLFFLGYCNDYHQYFPTIEASSEGGYGADPAVSPVETGAGEQMMDRALIRLYKMQGKLPDLPPDKK
ncbi:MAG: neutral/alkaline non-lysosomal ceramidase N-terminal domain-containing protein [Gemmataceae bacterium]